MDKLFGTDGVRGTPGDYPLTDSMIFKLGKAASYLLISENTAPDRPLSIIIGKDTRLSGERIEVILSSGITSFDVSVALVGVIPTPGLAHLTKSYKADMGIMISASHNRAEENGIKFFSSSGYKLSESQEQHLEKLVFGYSSSFDLTRCTAGSIYHIKDGHDRYIEFLKNSVSNISLKDIKIVLDCAHGAVSDIAPRLFKEMGAEVISFHDKPNGLNINLNCGTLHPENIAKFVVDSKADIGFSFDGDADRLIISDELGNILDGDYIIAMVARDMINKGKLKDNIVVTTVMGNYGLQESIENMGGKLIRTKVGDRYVVEECLRNGVTFGGEQSGHIVFLEHSTTGDALITALQIIKLIKSCNEKLSVLSKCMRKYPQILLNIKVKEKISIEDLPLSSEVIRQSKLKLQGKGAVLVRYSGTESMCRVMVEGEREDLVKSIAYSIAQAIEKEIGIKK